MPRPVHFELPADDPARAVRFYESVFGWTFSPWGPPGFYMINDENRPPGAVRASLQGRREIVQGLPMHGFECTIAVDDVDRVAAAVVAAGGTVVMPKVTIAGVGDLIFFRDTEGNVAGAMRYDATAG